MNERKGLREKLSQVQDEIASGKVPSKSTMKELAFAYDKANNEAACPCGNEVKTADAIIPAKYADCCKREYLAVMRGAKAVKEEQKAGAKKAEEGEQKPAKEEEGQRQEQDVKWCCRVGVDRKTGEPVTDVTGMEMDDPRIPPHVIAGILLMAYHDLMASGSMMLAHGVYNRVMHDLGTAQAAARRKQRPPNRPVK